MKYTITATIALALSMGSFSLSQEEYNTVDLYLFGGSPMLASIVDAAPSATTVALACPSELSTEECPLDPFTVTLGPSFEVVEASGTVEGRVMYASISCSLEGRTYASCVQTMTSEGGREDVSTMVDTYTNDDESPWGPVIVTAGAELLSASGEPTPTDVPAASTGASAAESEATAAPPASASRSQTGTPNPTVSSAEGASSTGAASSKNIVKSAGMAGIMGAVLAVLAL